MIKLSLTAAVAAGLLLSSIGTVERAAAQSVEIKVLASVALTSALDEIAPQFERATGNKLTLGYSLIADIKKRILAGETADLIILSRPVMDDPAESGQDRARQHYGYCGNADCDRGEGGVRRSRISPRSMR